MHHTSAPFTVGIIQDSASDDAAATVAASVERIREAAARGAQIICLKELFNAPYFCKSQKCERFDLAEPIPGPTTNQMQSLAKELEIVLIVPIFEKQARGVYRNSAEIIDADGSNKKQLTKLGGHNSYSSWSPDGKKIVFQHNDGQGGNGSLWVMDADGGNAKEVDAKADLPAEGGRVAWRPK